MEGFSKGTLQDHVYQHIRSRIINGTYRPNERLVELKIAKELGVSQGPVREALQELEVMGLVYKKAYSGSLSLLFRRKKSSAILSSIRCWKRSRSKRPSKRWASRKSGK